MMFTLLSMVKPQLAEHSSLAMLAITKFLTFYNVSANFGILITVSGKFIPL